jgi:superfamily II DNA or RNA helicase
MPLYKFQEDIVSKTPNKWGCFADCGVGKSAICINLANKTPAGTRILIITTKSLKKNWANEIEMWGNREHHEYHVMSKEEFRRDHKKIPACNVFIFDEGHNAAYPTNQIHKACWWYLNAHKCQFVWFATATPILANVMSVWGLSRLLGRPLGTYTQFRFKYFRQVPMGFRKIWQQRRGIEKEIADDLKKIGTVLSKDECLDLPEFVHEFEFFDKTPEQKRAVKALDLVPNTTVPIVYWTKQLQIMSGTCDGAEIKCEKLKRAVELAEQFPRCVIVAKHTHELNMLQRAIKGSRIFNGATSIEDRDEIIKEANEGKCTMLAQADCLVGFNLVGVSLMIFYSHPMSFISYYQGLGRIHRIGQKNKCTYIHLITDKSIDHDVWKSLERKQDFDIELYNRTTSS